MVNLSATLTKAADGTSVSGKSINFALNGTSVGSAITDSNGLATLNNASLNGINAGSYPAGTNSGVSATFAGDSSLGSSNGANTLTVAQKAVTGSITAQNKVYDGTASATIATRSLTGVIGTDDVSLMGGTATFDNKNVGAGKTVTATALTLTGLKAGNYELVSTTAITTADITVKTSFGQHIAEVLAMPRVDPARGPGADSSAPHEIIDSPTEANGGTTAYRHFVEACVAEDRGDTEHAEHLFRQAIDLEPNMAAALTNLGNIVYRQGEADEARRLYERALDHDPNQPEARYNLANLLEDVGEIELAVTELRKVCAAAPDFADAHYNLGLMLAQLGGAAQAKQHMERYLELDGASDWATHARSYLDQFAAA
jgi:hypothetical protein